MNFPLSDNGAPIGAQDDPVRAEVLPNGMVAISPAELNKLIGKKLDEQYRDYQYKKERSQHFWYAMIGLSTAVVAIVRVLEHFSSRRKN